MNFIEHKKYAKIRELANSGDEKAKDFLFNFMTMNDDEVNKYLVDIAIDEKSDFAKVVKDLVANENEAIDGYDKAIKYLINSNEERKEEKIKVLEKIKADEMQHIEDLKGMI